MLESIDYKKIFYYFEKISSVPRNSKYNEKISRFLVDFAKERGLPVTQDPFFNVIITKEASKGCENSPAVILQGHMDMVCVREEMVSHDFETEGLALRLDGDFIYAEGTSLGADDGIAVAYALAVLDDDTLVHPKLEVVITTDEEIGMDGAKGLDMSALTAGYLLNLDSEDEGILLSSCAGGLTAVCSIPVERRRARGARYEITLDGLRGGHSGTEIDKIRANAVTLLGRLLFELCPGENGICLEDIGGGTRDNVIPNAASAAVLVEKEKEEAFCGAVSRLTAVYKQELCSSDPGLNVKAVRKEAEGSADVLTEDALEKLFMMLLLAPEGIQKMSFDIPGLVESSLNLGTLRLFETKVRFSYGVRSSVGTGRQLIREKLEFLTAFLGGSCEADGEYPAWEYKKESRLREICAGTFQEQYGCEPKIEAIHAGLECGIIADKMPGIDAISLGPDILDAHTAKERLSISSAKRVYDFLLRVLERIGMEG